MTPAAATPPSRRPRPPQRRGKGRGGEEEERGEAEEEDDCREGMDQPRNNAGMEGKGMDLGGDDDETTALYIRSTAGFYYCF